MTELIDDLLLELGQAVLQLFGATRGAMHGIYQGSQEAALFEAQGGQIGPGGFNHLGDVINTANAIQARQATAELALNRISGVDPAIGTRLRTLCEPVLQISREYVRTAAATNNAATVLRQTDPNRFSGVILGQGGLGPEIGRTTQALVTNQINAMSGQLVARGIEPRLIPSTQSALDPTLTAIRRLPLDGKEAAQKLAGAIGAIRLLLTQTLARASVIGRARLVATILGLERLLVDFGARLTTPIILIDRRLLRQIMGVPDIEA